MFRETSSGLVSLMKPPKADFYRVIGTQMSSISGSFVCQENVTLLVSNSTIFCFPSELIVAVLLFKHGHETLDSASITRTSAKNDVFWDTIKPSYSRYFTPYYSSDSVHCLLSILVAAGTHSWPFRGKPLSVMVGSTESCREYAPHDD